ncbi:hypothetical protein MKZ38_003469 [Zalerion maritima]|uniref:F-box domain-containing protein n=1 Tax=Zalerion maritima TaxID=339359 RepID=A0AAD5RWQ0_9PEZI|nr:hypothetical protein MKZ38_003469 [Zalerion maritima]
MPHASLSGCPNEILGHIFSYLRLDVDDISPFSKLHSPNGGLWAVCLTSRRFHGIAQPILAETVWAEAGTWPSVCRLFLRHPHLRSKVKQLRMEEHFTDYYSVQHGMTTSDPLDEDELEDVANAASEFKLGRNARQVVELKDGDKCATFLLFFHWFTNVQTFGFFPGADQSISPDFRRGIQEAPQLGILSHLREVSLGPPAWACRAQWNHVDTVVHFEPCAMMLNPILRIPNLKVLRLTSVTIAPSKRGSPVVNTLQDGESSVEELYLTEVTCGLVRGLLHLDSSEEGNSELARLFATCKQLRVVQMVEHKNIFPNSFSLEPLRVLLTHHRTHLEELWWSCLETAWDEILEETPIWKCSALRFLYLSYLQKPEGHLRFPPVDQLPPLLDRLGLQRMPEATEKYFRALKSPMPPTYKTPRIHLDGDHELCDPFNDLDSDPGGPYEEVDSEEDEYGEDDHDEDEPSGESHGFDEFNDSPPKDNEDGYGEDYDSDRGEIDYNNPMGGGYGEDDDDDSEYDNSYY